jgi:hypothetical protein
VTVDVYKPLSLEGTELCHPHAKHDFEAITRLINGTPRSATWQPIAMRLIHADEGRSLSASDSPWLGTHALIFRRIVVDKLGEVLRRHGEVLPLSCPEAELYIFNPTHVVDALDIDASVVHRFSDGGLMRISQHAFRPEIIGNLLIFKIVGLRSSPTFVTGPFVDLWKAARLKGLKFNKVWSQRETARA